jgi:hypothetical protein
MLDEFIGNKTTIKCIGDWLSVYYEDRKKATNNYVILFGNSGNGKTFLVSLLAKIYGVELFHITPDDIRSKENAYEIYKSINLATLENTKYKLILIDDVDEIDSKYLETILEIGKISIYPVIYTSKTYSLPKEFKEDSLKEIILDYKQEVKQKRFLKVIKPLTSELKEHLKTKANELGMNISDAVLHDIALNSKSVRSAELSLYNNAVNELVDPEQTKREILESLPKRKLKYPLTRKNDGPGNIYFIFNSIRGYDDNAFKVMMKFAEFEYRIIVKHEEIDPILVNEMSEPIELVKFEYIYHNNSKEKPGINQREPTRPQNVEPKTDTKKVPSVDKWL